MITEAMLRWSEIVDRKLGDRDRHLSVLKPLKCRILDGDSRPSVQLPFDALAAILRALHYVVGSY
jgi:hypothetical protein